MRLTEFWNPSLQYATDISRDNQLSLYLIYDIDIGDILGIYRTWDIHRGLSEGTML